MPIYEFFCESCNTLFQFFSRRINTEARPVCPKCAGALSRQMSVFAAIGRAKEEADNPLAGLDEARMESVLGELAREAEHLSEDDPRQMANLMRRFQEKTGLDLGSGMEEALARLEAGEDPEAIEQEMGDILDGDDAISFLGKAGRSGGRVAAPLRDETLYEL